MSQPYLTGDEDELVAFSGVCIIDFEQVKVCWKACLKSSFVFYTTNVSRTINVIIKKTLLPTK